MSAEDAMAVITRIRVTHQVRITVSRAEQEDGTILVQMTARRADGAELTALEPEPLAAANRLEQLLILDDRARNEPEG